MKKIKKPAWIDEFKEFAIKGNAMALAVGTIIGGAFTTITKSLTNDIIMPIINIFAGGANFEKLRIPLFYAPWVTPPQVQQLDELGQVVLGADGNPVMVDAVNYLTWGNLLSAGINFITLALVVFLLVKLISKLADMGKKKEEPVAEEPPAPPAPSNEEVLLTEIRDLLKEK